MLGKFSRLFGRMPFGEAAPDNEFHRLAHLDEVPVGIVEAHYALLPVVPARRVQQFHRFRHTSSRCMKASRSSVSK